MSSLSTGAQLFYVSVDNCEKKDVLASSKVLGKWTTENDRRLLQSAHMSAIQNHRLGLES